ncbi:uncharacterized protein [Solanum lycopersicum]|uniref:uncharacterized protein isoform X1 n=1 Tax=Solanum lycopersicum TaxID=4081 RepID=UPI000532AA70
MMRRSRQVRRLQQSAEAICSELPHQYNQSSTPSRGDGVFYDERPSVKMKLVNIWNNKLQSQGECTSTHDEESIEGAIMLGDALLPSTCSFIVEELRQTSCFKLVENCISGNIWFGTSFDDIYFAIIILKENLIWSTMHLNRFNK